MNDNGIKTIADGTFKKFAHLSRWYVLVGTKFKLTNYNPHSKRNRSFAAYSLI